MSSWSLSLRLLSTLIINDMLNRYYNWGESFVNRKCEKIHMVELVSNLEIIGNEFKKKASALVLVTLISWAFSGETDEDFVQTVDLVKDYKFPQVHISQFYPRPGL